MQRDLLRFPAAPHSAIASGSVIVGLAALVLARESMRITEKDTTLYVLSSVETALVPVFLLLLDNV